MAQNFEVAKKLIFSPSFLAEQNPREENGQNHRVKLSVFMCLSQNYNLEFQFSRISLNSVRDYVTINDFGLLEVQGGQIDKVLTSNRVTNSREERWLSL